MITRLFIQNYKSVGEIDLQLSPITVLAGPNGAGKSNIIDALHFFHDALTYGLEQAANRREGASVVRRYSPRQPFTMVWKIEVEYLLPETQIVGRGTYQLRVGGPKNELQVLEEEAEWDEFATSNAGGLLSQVANETFAPDEREIIKKSFKREKNRFAMGEYKDGFISSDQLGLSFFRAIFLFSEPFYQQLTDLQFISIFPNKLREPNRLETDRQLKEDGSNWASVIKAMRKSRDGEQALTHIGEFMAAILPGYRQIKVKNVGGYIVPQFLVADSEQGKAHYFDPVQMSDGTLRIFGILLALYQHPHPTFLAIEEPEQTVHPGLLAVLADAFREVSGRTQVLLTSHSPQLLDHFAPEEIRAVVMTNGQTQASMIRESQRKAIHERLMSMGEIMGLDGLQPEVN
jgi:predicted ATPase